MAKHREMQLLEDPLMNPNMYNNGGRVLGRTPRSDRYREVRHGGGDNKSSFSLAYNSSEPGKD
jgi:hypothetical protein